MLGPRRASGFHVTHGVTRSPHEAMSALLSRVSLPWQRFSTLLASRDRSPRPRGLPAERGAGNPFRLSTRIRA